MANEFDTHSMISNQASITSASSLASLLREKMQVNIFFCKMTNMHSKQFLCHVRANNNNLIKMYELWADLSVSYNMNECLILRCKTNMYLYLLSMNKVSHTIVYM